MTKYIWAIIAILYNISTTGFSYKKRLNHWNFDLNCFKLRKVPNGKHRCIMITVRVKKPLAFNSVICRIIGT